MTLTAALLWLALGAGSGVGVGGPAAGAGPRGEILEAFNDLRRETGAAPVVPHPALCAVAQKRAENVAARGDVKTDVGVLRRTSAALRRDGYEAHRWIESTLIGSRDQGALEQWQEANPRWLDEAAGGDFEHAGIGLARYTPAGGRSQPVFTLLLALEKRTWELRRARPLEDLEEVRRIVLDAVNAARRKHRRPPVEADPRLDLAAQRHAEDMLRRAYYSHVTPDGVTAGKRARAAGFPRGVGIGENIAKGLFDADEAVRRWLDSPGHRKNILRRSTGYMGVGVAFGENENGFEVIWVQLFGG